jgi:crotonobetainyl-CoA:carnitine CoA-transferase CaiB-like acyl-CoA transferase
MWQRFCEAIEDPELARRPEFATNPDRVAHREALERRLSERLRTRTVSDWLERLGQAGVSCGQVRTVPEALAATQVAARGMVAPLAHPKIPDFRVVNLPVQLSETPGSPSSPPPLLGEHTARVLGELGYDEAAVRELRAAGAV